MHISKYVILFCMLLMNNTGFATQNLSNQYKDVVFDFGIEQNNQISLVIQKQLKQQDSTSVQTQMIENNNQVLEDFDMLMQIKMKNVLSNLLEQNISEIQNGNEHQKLQDLQTENLEQSQLLIAEDYEVTNIVNQDVDDTQISQGKLSNIIPQMNKDDDNFQNKEESNQQAQVQNIISNEISFNDETGFIRDSPQDLDLSNNQKGIINSQSNKDDQINYEYSSSNNINSTIDNSQNQNSLQTIPLKEQQDNNNQNQMNNQGVEEICNENQEQKRLLNAQNTPQNYQNKLNDQPETSNLNKVKEFDNQAQSQDYQHQINQDSLQQGYIIQNNVETDDYLKDLQKVEKSSEQQEVDLQNKLEYEEEYLKQLKIIKEADENQLRELEEKEKLFHDSEQNEEQQIMQINKQLEIHENELQKIVNHNENDQYHSNNQQEIYGQTQFQPYEGQELIISSEVNYDEGNIEQFENSQEMIVETYQKLQEQNDDNNEVNQNNYTKSQENFQQSNSFSISEKENTLNENFDKSIPAEPQEISINMNLTSQPSKSKIYLSQDILYENDQQQLDIKSDLSEIDQPQNFKPDKENMNKNIQNNQNQQFSSPEHAEQQNQKQEGNNFQTNNLKQDQSSNIQDQKNEIINGENNSQMPQFNQKSQQNINSQITLAQNNNQEFAQIQNQSTIIQTDNLLTFQGTNYQKSNQQYLKDSSFQQVQQQFKTKQTKNNFRGSQKNMLDSSMCFFQKENVKSKITYDGNDQNSQRFKLAEQNQTEIKDPIPQMTVKKQNEDQFIS